MSDNGQADTGNPSSPGGPHRGHDEAPGIEPLASGRKGEILSAAMDVFGTQGYEGGSMREIASRVGVSEPAIYRHFSGKEALFLALLRLGAGRAREEAYALIDSVEPPDLGAQILAAIANRRRAVRLYAPLLRTVLPAAARNEGFRNEFRDVMVEPLRRKLVAKAEQVDRFMGVKDADASREARVRALMSLLVGYFVSSFVLGDEVDDAIVDAALRVMGWDE